MKLFLLWPLLTLAMRFIIFSPPAQFTAAFYELAEEM